MKGSYSFYILNLLTIFLIFGSCSFLDTKENYLIDFDAFIKNVKAESTNYKPEDWNRIDIEYNRFADEQYQKFRPELTETERETIGKLKGEFTLIKVKKEIQDGYETTKDILYQVKGVVDAVSDSLNN